MWSVGQDQSLEGFHPARIGQPGVVGEDLHDRRSEPDAGLDPLDLEHLVPLDQGHHQPGLAGPGGPARPVEVRLVVLGRIEVDDHVHHVDVQAPGGDVGGHQGGQLALAEVLQRPLPIGLAEVAVDGVGPDPLLAELLDQPVGTPLGAHEDQGLLRVPADGGAHLDPVHLVHLEEPVLHGVDGGVGRGHLVEDRVGEVPADQPVDRPVEGGREQQGLVLPLEAAEHPFDLGHEAHVGHAVRLVEHQGLDVGHRQLAPVAEIDEAARRGDDHVHAPSELLDLAFDVGPAVDGGDPEPGLFGQRLEHLAHLHGQLTGGDEDEGPGPARLGGPGRHGALEQRDAEGQASCPSRSWPSRTRRARPGRRPRSWPGWRR